MKTKYLGVGSVVVVLLAGCASHKSQEVAVNLADTPSAVRATLERESAGGKITEVERETKKGKTIYSADLVINGQAWDIAVAEDGTVLSKEKEEDEKETSDSKK